MIEVRGLSFTYAGSAEPALRDIDLEIPASQLCAVVGANGAGKSSLCHALTGFIPHFYRGALAGRVHVAGHNVPETSLADLAGDVGLVFQNPFNQITGARFTVLEEVAFGLENLGLPRAEMLDRCLEALALTGLESVADRSPYQLSGGQQQRLAVASMLAMKPKVLVLDEPTSQLDPAGTEAIFAHLQQLSSRGEMTIVLTEHKLEWVASFAPRVVLLSGGRIVADGPPRQVLASEALEANGVLPTRCTQAARQLRSLGLASRDRPLPVTVEQTAEYLR
ncbi:MAG: ABC transporter ATP-binding protein [Chloroflexota bacterium]